MFNDVVPHSGSNVLVRHAAIIEPVRFARQSKSNLPLLKPNDVSRDLSEQTARASQI